MLKHPLSSVTRNSAIRPSLVINSFDRICLSCSGECDVLVDVQIGFVFFEKRLNFLNRPFSWKLSSFLRNQARGEFIRSGYLISGAVRGRRANLLFRVKIELKGQMHFNERCKLLKVLETQPHGQVSVDVASHAVVHPGLCYRAPLMLTQRKHVHPRNPPSPRNSRLYPAPLHLSIHFHEPMVGQQPLYLITLKDTRQDNAAT